jgi:hypothetical protein
MPERRSLSNRGLHDSPPTVGDDRAKLASSRARRERADGPSWHYYLTRPTPAAVLDRPLALRDEGQGDVTGGVGAGPLDRRGARPRAGQRPLSPEKADEKCSD